MNRDKYVEMRNNHTIDLSLMYQYYTEHTNTVFNEEEFIEMFKVFLNFADINQILEKIDLEYSVNIITQNNKFIKAL